MVEVDGRVRAELVAEGALYDGYHPRMAVVHERHAKALGSIIDEYGWPGRALVGDDGADAAWLILQHAVCVPALQRRALPLLEAAAKAGDIPACQVAYLHDRICAHEERPQRYGTQFDWDDEGRLSPQSIEEPDKVDHYRAEVGLGPLSERIREMRLDAAREGAKPPADINKWRSEKRAWAVSVGWLAAEEDSARATT